MMQQRVKPSAQELVQGWLFLLVGGGWTAYWLQPYLFPFSGPNPVDLSRPLSEIVAEASTILTFLLHGLTGILLLCRQHRAAAKLQGASALAMLYVLPTTLYALYRSSQPPSSYEWLVGTGYVVFALWIFAAAWLLLRQAGEK